MFVLEEPRRFGHQTTIAMFGASAGAIAVARVLLGHTPDFRVEAIALPRFRQPIHVALGIVAGLLGIAYNLPRHPRSRTGSPLAGGTARRHDRATVGLSHGSLAWSVGWRDHPAHARRRIRSSLSLVSAPVRTRGRSYAAQAPGGLFALCSSCAQTGQLFDRLYLLAPTLFRTRRPGRHRMAAFFAVVRADQHHPGHRDDGSFVLLPMSVRAAACSADSLRDPPIYDSLLALSDLKHEEMAPAELTAS